MLNAPFLAAAASATAETQPTYLFVWEQLEGPGLAIIVILVLFSCLLYTSPSPRDQVVSRMPSSA